MDERKGNVLTHKGTRYAGANQKGADPAGISDPIKPPGPHFLWVPGRGTVIDRKNAVPSPVAPVNPAAPKKIFFPEDAERIPWVTSEKPVQFNLGLRRMCNLIRRKGLVRASSTFSSLYKKFLNHLEVTAQEELIATGTRRARVRKLRRIATGTVPGKEELGTLVQLALLGETFVLPESFFTDCSLALLELSPRGE